MHAASHAWRAPSLPDGVLGADFLKHRAALQPAAPNGGGASASGGGRQPTEAFNKQVDMASDKFEAHVGNGAWSAGKGHARKPSEH